MKTRSQKGILIEFVFGNAPFLDGYAQIGSFKNDEPNWPTIYITAPADWVTTIYTNPGKVKDKLQEMVDLFVKAFNAGYVDTNSDRFRYYVINDNIDTVITLGYFKNGKNGITFISGDPLTDEEFLEFQDAQKKSPNSIEIHCGLIQLLIITGNFAKLYNSFKKIF